MTDVSTDDIEDEDEDDGLELTEAELELLRQFKKRQKIRNIGLGIGAVFALLIWFMLQPVRGGLEFGICKTYLEQYVRYPRTLRLTQYDIFGKSMRIFYTFRDPFGMDHSEMIECIAAQDPATGQMFMQQIKIDRKPISKEKLQLFNRSIPAILSTEIDLAIPQLRGDEPLSKLKVD